ncbi:hypothetical protein GN956_G7567 [Arapaima gigas]
MEDGGGACYFTASELGCAQHMRSVLSDLEPFRHYIDPSRTQVDKDDVVELIAGAKVLQIDTMSHQITVDSCYEVLTAAKKQGLTELTEAAYRFMSDHLLEILREPALYGRLSAHERDLLLRTRMDGDKSLMVAEINDVYERPRSRPPSRDSSRPQSPLSVVSLEEDRMIYRYSETSGEWKPLARMPQDANTRGCGMCTMYNYLFVAGGIRGDRGKVSDKVFCYNPITDTWSEIRPLTEPRSQLKLVALDGCLYAIGGECLFTVEKYDPRADRWTPVAPLPRGAFAVAHEATTCNGEIYVSGGSLFYRLLRFDVNRDRGISVFRYDTVVKAWQDAGSLEQEQPLPFRCALVGNRVYCVNRSRTLRCLLDEDSIRFDPQPLKAPPEAKGALFPFVLSLREKRE